MKAKIYKVVFVELTDEEVLIKTKGQPLSERMEKPDGECPRCQYTEWALLPDDSEAVKEGGKPYIECIRCGYMSHL